ncbi:hypothetical protein C8F01DRAFT_1125447 [Mycena amicta]|nr:hypothetical protein C8F01DRAFT_1125447 [Mycena amicta]
MGGEQARRIGQAWETQLLWLVSAEVQRLKAAAGPRHNTRSLVQRVFRARQESHEHTSIPDTSDVWKEEILPLLEELACNPAALNVENLVQRKILRSSSTTELERSDDFCRCYLRVIAVTGATAREALVNYLQRHPADAPHTIIALLLYGASLRDVELALRETCAPYGLGAAVDVLTCGIFKSVAMLELVEHRSATEPTTSVYAGVTFFSPEDRAVNDLRNNLKNRFTNFCKANPHLLVETFHIPAFDLRLPSHLHVRTNELLSQQERVLCGLIGEVGLNSAFGGFRPVAQPPETYLSLRTLALQRAPQPAYPLGRESAEDIVNTMIALARDERTFLERLEDMEIAPKYAKTVEDYFRPMRRNRGRVVVITILKDSTREEMDGRTDGYFGQYAGPGPQEHRHFLGQIHINLPPNGVLPLNLLADLIGAIMDFWKFVRLHERQYVHSLFLARYLDTCRPLCILVSSNPVAKLLLSGILAQPRENLATKEFLDGHTTSEFLSQLPDMPYQKYKKAEFIDVVGNIYIVAIGPNRFAIVIADAHCGALKYKPRLYMLRSRIHFLVAIIQRVVVCIIADHLETSSADNDSKEFLERVRDQALQILVEVYAELNKVKTVLREQEYSTGFLESLAQLRTKHLSFLPTNPTSPSTSISDHYVPIDRAVGLIAVAGDQARLQQYELLVGLANSLRSYGMAHDIFKLESFGRQIGSEAFKLWFFSVGDGKSFSASASAQGKSAEGAARAQASRKKLSNNRPGAEDPDAQRRRLFEDAMTEYAIPPPYKIQRMDRSCRIGQCDLCPWFGLGIHSLSKHRCADGKEQSLSLLNFKWLEKFLYPHDAEPYLATLSPDDKKALLKNLGLVKFTVGGVILNNLDELRKALPDQADLDAIVRGAELSGDHYIYASPANATTEYLVTMAVAVVLREHTASHLRTDFSLENLGQHFEPSNRQRDGWSKTSLGYLQSWITSRGTSQFESRKLYFSCCRVDAGRPYVFMTNKPNPIMKDRVCASCKKRNCRTAEVREARTILHFPNHFAQVMWFIHRMAFVVPEDWDEE